MYKVTITQDLIKEISLEYECLNDVFGLIDRVLFGDSKAKITIEITEGSAE